MTSTATVRSEIVRFLRTQGRRRQFFPVWSETRLLSLTRSLGLRVEDIQVARRNGSIVGLMALWDQSAYKQNVVHSYSGWMKFAAPLYNAAAPLLMRSRLPPPGEKIRNAYAAFICVSNDDSAVFSDLLMETMELLILFQDWLLAPTWPASRSLLTMPYSASWL